ncbi:MAG: rhodanese-like domain-containing protein [Rhodospirillaceae bacterium]|jgi:rhodanese-related sulfurtransferase|nr:rhodanese-like domain-containing protein [Rhodospirillales bacterium]MBT3905353.1 rhodanese-like domain-containing protein [Rhodospirillaceae bacterium]MBT4702913.1 rhodanese-like domain-containing protein [Rhodospirillaceae bacterium]MBT5035619.1 rhodanese-like domain-containing protein [Rhodospirillaceae bacterium]MBT6219397.1 rhodanese-like domain-containing protein [Rhodospirillaceae bacterium]
MSDEGYAGDIMPAEAWKILADDPKAVLIDVRTTAEWVYVGQADISSLSKETVLLEWKVFPAMESNPEFVGELSAKISDKDAPLLFLCRSGVRSKAAAITMTAEGYATCYNIATGFEGDKDSDGHRGHVGGWKVEGLPWMQG